MKHCRHTHGSTDAYVQLLTLSPQVAQHEVPRGVSQANNLRRRAYCSTERCLVEHAILCVLWHFKCPSR